MSDSETPQVTSTSYKLGFEDEDLMLRPEMRPVRLQLELAKPDIVLEEHRINSTIVVFGSARLPTPDDAMRACDKAHRALKSDPENEDLQREVRRAEKTRARSRYYEEARAFARLVSEASQNNDDLDYVVATGGGPGIMEAANRGAADAGALSIGFNIALPHEQHPNAYITPELCFQFHYFALRKMHLLMRAKGLVIFPGGFGTLDELFETLTLIQTGKVEPMPVLLFGKEYWSGLIDFEAMVEEGVIDDKDLSIFTYVESAEEAWAYISAYYGTEDTPPPLMRTTPL